MTTFFRSPSVLVDNHEWYVAVERQSRGGAYMVFRFRPLPNGGPPVAWRSMRHWPGRRLPKGLRGFFRPYENAIETARANSDRQFPVAA